MVCWNAYLAGDTVEGYMVFQSMQQTIVLRRTASSRQDRSTNPGDDAHAVPSLYT